MLCSGFEPRPQDGGRRRIHCAMTAAQLFHQLLVTAYSEKSTLQLKLLSIFPIATKQLYGNSQSDVKAVSAP